jgi:hypothetical protein
MWLKAGLCTESEPLLGPEQKQPFGDPENPGLEQVEKRSSPFANSFSGATQVLVRWNRDGPVRTAQNGTRFVKLDLASHKSVILA